MSGNVEDKMKKMIVTGAAGFAGCNLTEQLIEDGYYVYAIVRPGSAHNARLSLLPADSIRVIELETGAYSMLAELIGDSACDTFFHLAWGSRGRDDFASCYSNLSHYVQSVEAAHRIGCRKYIATGSQAEYGVKSEAITEDSAPEPFSAYGAVKAAACYLTKNLCGQYGMEWNWGRIFSLIGKYEPDGRLFPDLLRRLHDGEAIRLSSGTQNWDYLDASDCAKALIAIAERGVPGEIYNLASGDFHPLRFFTEKMREMVAPDARIHYGEAVSPFVSLRPSVEKLKRDTGWTPKISFEETVQRALYSLQEGTGRL